LLVVVANACVFSGAVMFEDGGGGTLPLLSLVGLPLVLFGSKDRCLVALGAVLPALLFAACESGAAAKALSIAVKPAPAWYFAGNVATAFTVAFVITYFFYWSNLKAEALLERTGRQRLKSVIREKREALRVRDLFDSIASHELKTPLTVLTLGLDLLRRRLDAQNPINLAAKQQAERCASSAARMNELVQTLLDVAQIHSGRLRLQACEVDLTDAVGRIVSGFEASHICGDRQIQLQAPGAVTAWLDPLRFDQVLTNLLSNALKYGGREPIEVCVSEDRARDVARIEVIDHGPGIEPAMMELIFEPFRRAVRHEGLIPGLGLGLYIVKTIVESHGGRIDVQSEPGHGSRFVVDVPRVAQPAA
jgi:signal transduction histidine kinase